MMKLHPLILFRRFSWVLVFLSTSCFADQTDSRLDDLFATLQSDENSVVQQETIQSIWTIWYESDNQQIEKLLQEGEQAVRSGKLKKAEGIFTEIIEKSPEFSEGWNRRATVRYNLQDYPGSLEDIQKTLDLEPRHFGAIWGKGMILGLQRDFSGAIDAFKKMLQITPYSDDAKRRIELLEKEIRKNTA